MEDNQGKMVCPLCHRRKAKRACPAVGRQICTVCCGTKRLVEISCPADCVYLATARTHPPAVVQRQQEHDRGLFLPLLQGLSERQARLMLMLATVTSRHQGEAFQKLVDDDIAQAAGALAATLETAGRGILYEHQPASLPAARLMAELKTVIADVTKSGGSALERDAAIGLRRLEIAARETSKAHTNSNEFQQLLARVLAPQPGSEKSTESEGPTAPASSLIIP
jgi:hypothetical protein